MFIRLALIIGMSVGSLLVICKPHLDDLEKHGVASLNGTVLYRPGYDAMPPVTSDPPPFRPEPGVKVYLFATEANSSGPITKANVLTSAVTDSSGNYQLQWHPGSYYLGLYHERCGAWISDLADGTDIKDFPLCQALKVTLVADSTIVRQDSLFGLVTQ